MAPSKKKASKTVTDTDISKKEVESATEDNSSLDETVTDAEEVEMAKTAVSKTKGKSKNKSTTTDDSAAVKKSAPKEKVMHSKAASEEKPSRKPAQKEKKETEDNSRTRRPKENLQPNKMPTAKVVAKLKSKNASTEKAKTTKAAKPKTTASSKNVEKSETHSKAEPKPKPKLKPISKSQIMLPLTSAKDIMHSKKPSTAQLVNTAILNLNNSRGSSLRAIKDYISGNHAGIDIDKLSLHIKKYIKKAVEDGTLIQKNKETKVNLASSFKIASAYQRKKAKTNKNENNPEE